MHSAIILYCFLFCCFYSILPLTPDCSWVDLESWIDTDWALMEGENASNVDVSFLRKLR